MNTNKEHVYPEWKPSMQRLVGFIDIMGFKDIVARQNHIDIYRMMEKIYESQKRNVKAEWVKKRDLVKVTMYSDSIMIYSKDATKDSILSFICTISGIIFDLFMEQIPHKGAVAFGQMTIDQKKSIFFGQPLIDAFLLQEELGFYGVVIHGSAQKIIDTVDNVAFIHEYSCPFKKGKSKHHVIYPIFIGDEYSEIEKDMMDSIRKMRYETSGFIRKYIDNTEEYLNEIINLNKGS